MSLQQFRNESVIERVYFNVSGSFSCNESANRVKHSYSVPVASAAMSLWILVNGSSRVIVCA